MKLTPSESDEPKNVEKLADATRLGSGNTPIFARCRGRKNGASGAGDGDRTRMASLEGWSSTIELHPRASRGSHKSRAHHLA